MRRVLPMPCLLTFRRRCDALSAAGPSTRIIRSAVVASALILAGCVSPPPLVVSKTPCSTLLPEAWEEPVKGPDEVDYETIGEMAAALDVLTGKLGVVNDRFAAAIHIIRSCEERDRAVTQPRKRLLGVW